MIDQHLARTKLENLLRDQDGELYELALRLDVIDSQIWDERFLQFQATRRRLEQLGFDVTKFRPPPRPSRAEQRSAQHVCSTDDIEELVTVAQASTRQETALDRIHREWLASKSPC